VFPRGAFPIDGLRFAPLETLVRRVRLNWQIKTLLPVVIVLVNGLLLFALVTLTLEDPPATRFWPWDLPERS